MSCTLGTSYNYASGCLVGIGGVDTDYIIEFINVTAVAVTSNVVTGITRVSTKIFRSYILANEVGFDSDDPNPNAGTNSLLYKHIVGFTTNGISTAMKVEMKAMCQTPTLHIVKRRDGSCWLYGLTKGMNLVTPTAQNKKEGANGPQMTWQFEGTEPSFALEVDPTIIAALLVP